MTARLIALLVAVLLLLSGCSAGGGSDDEPGVASADGGSSDGSDVGADGSDAMDDAGSEEGSMEGEPQDGAVPVVPVAAADADGPMMVRRVSLEVLVDDVPAAVSRARATALSSGGWVASEEVTAGGEDGGAWATVVLRVPSDGLDAALTTLSALGSVTGSSSDADDVRAEYRDVEARVATLEAGADRLRELVGEATTVEAIASLERELSSREAELDALKARMQVLAQDVSRSTLTLHLAEDAQALTEAVPATGFLAGLRAGWDAFGRSLTVLLTALGAVLPFLLVAAAVGVPVITRRRRRRGVPASAAPASIQE